MEFGEETVMTGTPARQNARQVIDPDSWFASLSTSNVVRNSSISAIRGSASKVGSLLTGLKELLNLPKDYIDEFERVISMILDQETVTVDELIHTVATELSSTETTSLINLLYEVDIFFCLHFITLAYDPFPDAST